MSLQPQKRACVCATDDAKAAERGDEGKRKWLIFVEATWGEVKP